MNFGTKCIPTESSNFTLSKKNLLLAYFQGANCTKNGSKKGQKQKNFIAGKRLAFSTKIIKHKIPIFTISATFDKITSPVNLCVFEILALLTFSDFLA